MSRATPLTQDTRPSTPTPAPSANAPSSSLSSASSAGTGLGHDTINTFLDRQSQQLLIRLYQRPANCLSIFRLLHPLSRALLMALLFLPPDQPLPVDDAKALLKRAALERPAPPPPPSSSTASQQRGAAVVGGAAPPASQGVSAWEAALKRLDRLSILREKNGKLWMNAVWSEGLRRALIGGGNHRSFGVPCSRPLRNRRAGSVTIPRLDAYARDKWESILHYMVKTPGYSLPSSSVVFLLRQSGLVADPAEVADGANAPGGTARSRRSGRAAGDDDADELQITSRGFQFLLEDLNTQLWDLLLSYLNLSTLRSMDLVEVLSFLFLLGSLTLGQDYSIDDLGEAAAAAATAAAAGKAGETTKKAKRDETVLHMLQDFRELGLVYVVGGEGTLDDDDDDDMDDGEHGQAVQRRSDGGATRRGRLGKTDRFWPTRLATTLTNIGGVGAGVASALGRRGGGGGGGNGSVGGGGTTMAVEEGDADVDEGRGYVILETNYRIYAYTSNELRVSILSLFVDIKSRFPNLVTGAITRDSIKRALRSGIGAEQVIAYLEHHAHPQMVAKQRNGAGAREPLLPVTVTDQVRLWERERNRVQMEPGSLYLDFSSQGDFALVRDYARQLGVLVWQNEARRMFFVAAEGHEPVRDFIRRRLV